MTSARTGQQAQLYWLALHLVPGLGTRNALKLIRHFGDPQRIFHSSLSELRACAELPLAVAESIHSGITFEDANAEAEKAKAIQAEIVCYSDPRYPQRLKEIIDPPIYFMHVAASSCWHRIASRSLERAVRRRMAARWLKSWVENWRRRD